MNPQTATASAAQRNLSGACGLVEVDSGSELSVFIVGAGWRMGKKALAASARVPITAFVPAPNQTAPDSPKVAMMNRAENRQAVAEPKEFTKKRVPRYIPTTPKIATSSATTIGR